MGKLRLRNNGFRTSKQERKLVSIREGQRKRYCEEDHHQDLASKSVHADHSYAVTSRRFVPDISNIVHEEVLDNDGNNLTPTDDWHVGRRVVELDVIADHLQQSAIDLGLGEHQINGLLSILNIPTVSHCMIDNRIREVGDVIESVADESMEEWTEKEKEMTRETLLHDWFENRKSNQLSGRSKACRICQRAEISGSAKAMEPDMVVDMVKESRSKGANITAIIGDEDTTTIARLRAKVDPTIVKLSDSKPYEKPIRNRRTSHITQISARRGLETFSKYILPAREITPTAAEVTGLTFQNGSLYLLDKIVPAVT
ncbi:unnamed protein product [Mytilus coruscus]|uniref:Mutator-like transposase domain-containing protein n=1 Tax=Mytilus coruscus TaxID=42192 RepID=A0A6J7ZUR8_MYTCO|nr:unnamed protein product [Mytilus coruscus]